MTDGIKTFRNILKTDIGGLIIIYFLQPVTNRTVQYTVNFLI